MVIFGRGTTYYTHKWENAWFITDLPTIIWLLHTPLALLISITTSNIFNILLGTFLLLLPLVQTYGLHLYHEWATLRVILTSSAYGLIGMFLLINLTALNIIVFWAMLIEFTIAGILLFLWKKDPKK